MKTLIFYLCLCAGIYSCSMQPPTNTAALPADGFYLADSSSGYTTALTDADDYVPLSLAGVQNIAGENGAPAKLALSLTPEAAEKMKAFTGRHLMKKAALILNGKVVSTQLIRAVIAEGKLEITGSDSAANASLYTLLQNK